ncbi:plastocyanin/azurin family copper-binding protein [Pseudorhodobacter sp.]|uniref:plastocyanin/azurin family copper-binding protein n=1 Tax=Pseudorhodobacter sp. TaxID=1934400 RepID=UPI00264934F9|nr:plastocyanin/azurin family copper-binding protein [Pseudorhodobacter sp.]MDN5785848.1 plastocyanin/azurin family copper-binding protein [Pseudorhodobacter sp.]
MAAALSLSPGLAIGGPVAEIAMAGRPDGSKVWFDPYGVLIAPGQTVRWTNHDKANSHTATAYAPENDDHPRRIPEGAKPFNSDYLLPGESFEVTLEIPGVYDYFCIPHEMSGMVGRIIVAKPGETDFKDYPRGDLDDMVINGFPSIADILARGSVQVKE